MRKRKLYWVLGGLLAAAACGVGVHLVGNMASDNGLGGRDNNAAAAHVGPDCVPTRPSAKGTNGVGETPNTGVTSEATATRLAREACKGRLEIPDHSTVRVELEGDCYVVTFLIVPHTIRGPGPDYYAKVWVDKRSGKIRRLWGCN